VCNGDTGHTEAVQVLFDPALVSFERLCDLFWERLGDNRYLLNQASRAATVTSTRLSASSTWTSKKSTLALRKLRMLPTLRRNSGQETVRNLSACVCACARAR